jgi:cell pole-organizing protein PopZ
MGNPSAAHEPSMEEILASIRQIISEDGEGSASPKIENESQASPPPAAGTESPPDVLESGTSQLESEPEFEPEPSIEQHPIPAPTFRPHTITRAMPQQEPPAQQRSPMAGRSAVIEDDNPLLSPEKGKAVSGAFGTLAQTILAQNSRTLEDVVAEMLQPMLKSWLDDNLPTLVERMVQDEIERVSRGRR